MTGIVARLSGRGGASTTCLMPTESPASPSRRTGNLRAAAVRARSPPPAPFGTRGGSNAESSSSAAASPPPFARSFYKYNCWSQEAEQISREVAAASGGSSRPASTPARGRAARAAGATAVSAQAASPAVSQLLSSNHLRVRPGACGWWRMWVVRIAREIGRPARHRTAARLLAWVAAAAAPAACSIAHSTLLIQQRFLPW